jgi:hypothetical protein
MPDGFLLYKLKDIRKVNAQRDVLSQPHLRGVPVITKAEALYVSASEMHDEPASCYNCVRYNYDRSCGIIGKGVPIRKFTYPEKSSDTEKAIEYWPCCGMHEYGQPNYGPEEFGTTNDPGGIGLGWINAPEPGVAHGGANCGGQNGGDDCDHYLTTIDDKREAPTGFCRVLQMDVENGAVCGCWRDDDWVTYDRGINIIREQDHGRK